MTKKVLFVHDGPLMYDQENDRYLGVHYNDHVVKRYTYFGKNVTFLMRMEQMENGENSKFSEIKYDHFDFIEVPNFKSVSSYYKKGKAKSIIEQAVEDHDVIIARLPSVIGTIAFRHARKLGKPVLVEFVACVFDALWNYDWKGKLIAHYKYYSYRRLMRDATHTIYVTSEFLQQRYPAGGKSIGCSDVVLKPLDDDILNDRLKKIDERKKNDPLVLGTVAALNVPYKGQGDVIRAIGKLKKQGIEVEYKLVGQGDSSRLRKLVKEHNVDDLVEIIGSVQHDEVFDFLDSIDVYIQPSKQEGLPRAMVEAMSRACLTTGARTAGIPELIMDKYVFKPGNVTEIMDMITGVESKDLAEQAHVNFEKAKDFQSEILIHERESFYKEFKHDYDI